MAGHKYDPEKASSLDSKIRAFFMPSKVEVLEVMRPQKNEIWADLGCGTGFYSIPLSFAVKKVHALDISDKMITLLNQKIQLQGIKNIDSRVSEENVLPLVDDSVDAVLMSFVAHELENPPNFFSEISRVLKKQGRLYVIEFVKQRYTLGPPMKERLDREQIDQWSANSGMSPGANWQWAKSFLGWQYSRIDCWEYLKTE